MITPRSRLLWLVAATLIPAAVLCAVAPGSETLFALVCVVIAGVAVLDWVWSARLLAGVKVGAGGVTRLTKDSPGEVQIKVRDSGHGEMSIRLAVVLGPTFEVPQEFLEFSMPASAEQVGGQGQAGGAARLDNSRPQAGASQSSGEKAHPWWIVAWKCTPRKRGSFVLDRVYLERRSMMGLWSVRRTVGLGVLKEDVSSQAAASRAPAGPGGQGDLAQRPHGCEIRVYPSLLAERKNVSALFMYRGDYGSHSQRMIGKGREFEKLREYVAGDSYDELHWKATARHARPITKVYQIERTQEVYVIIDASRLSGRNFVLDAKNTGDSGKPAIGLPAAATQPRAAVPREEQAATQRVDTALERYITASLVMAIAAQRQGDQFGVLAFSSTIDAFVRSRAGKDHYRACREALYMLEPKTVSPDFAELFSFIRLRLRRRALLVFLTSLDDPMLAENFAAHVGLISRQHLVIVNTLRPPMCGPLFADESVTATREVYSRLAGHLQWQRLAELDKKLHRKGVSFNQLENETLCAQLVSQYMNVKRRQML